MPRTVSLVPLETRGYGILKIIKPALWGNAVKSPNTSVSAKTIKYRNDPSSQKC